MTVTLILAHSYYGQDEGRSSIAKTLAEYMLTTDHAASSYGSPVLVAPDGVAYGPLDTLPNGQSAWWEVEHANWHDASVDEMALGDKFVTRAMDGGKSMIGAA